MLVVVLVRHNDGDGIIEVRVSGMLTRAGAASLRSGLGKCLAEAPPAVIVDISRLKTADKTALMVFAAAAIGQQAPAVPLLLARPSPQLRRQLRGTITWFVTVYDTLRQAREAARQGPVALQQRLTLPPTIDAPAYARRLIDGVCEHWKLGPTVGIARVVVTELVSNAVIHAATPVTVVVRLTDTHLYLSVLDGSPDLPVRAPCDVSATPQATGNGLYLVDVLCAAWGTIPLMNGKRVWAAIRLITI